MSPVERIERFLPGITGRSVSLFGPDIDAARNQLSEQIGGASALVVGGAGTIGSSFVKCLLPYSPRKVVVLDHSENSLAEQIRDLRSTHGMRVPDEFITYPVDYADPVAERIVAHHGPFDIVANFAAHKHVRSEKDVFSIQAMLENNVFRARRFMDRLTHSPPRHMFAVSTDKAANPVSIMGASKKLMEQLLAAYADRIPVSTARFANVAFSNGSLLQAFMARLARGQPLSAPNDVRRYFVTPEESGQICLLACMLGQAGEIFFPKLNEADHARRFSDIAVALLGELGFTPMLCDSEDEARHRASVRTPGSSDYPVYFFSSSTSGEKDLEEFYTPDESVSLDRYQGLGVVRMAAQTDAHRLFDFIEKLEARFQGKPPGKAAIVDAFATHFGSFGHVETGTNLDSRM